MRTPATFPALLADQLRRDPGRPLVTFYDDATGERVELSVTTYANWVAKTASLLQEEYDVERGGTVLVDLPAHWLVPVFLGAVWSVGARVATDETAAASTADLVVTGGPNPATADQVAAGTPTLATALLPLGVRYPSALTEGMHDFGIEVWGQPDAFAPWDPPVGDDEALPGVSQAQLLATPPQAGRLLTTANPLVDPAVFVGPLLGGGSLVLVRHEDPAGREARVAAERVTATA